MEQQQNKMTGGPAVNPGKRFWHVWGPVIIKMAISFGTSIMAMMVCAFVYMSAHYEEFMSAVDNQDKMMEFYAANAEAVTKMVLSAGAILEGVAALIAIPVMLIFFHKDRVREKLAGIPANKKAPIWKYGAVLIMSVALSLGLNNLIILGNLSAISASYEETMEVFYTPGLAVQIVCLAVLMPICEELVYRGLLFKRLRESGNYLMSALYSSALFGIMHGNMIQMLYGFILGMMLTYIYEKYGSIKAPIAAHIAMNLLSVLATYYNLLDWMAADIMRIGTVTVICAALAATMFVFIQRIEEHPDVPDKPESVLGHV